MNHLKTGSAQFIAVWNCCGQLQIYEIFPLCTYTIGFKGKVKRSMKDRHLHPRLLAKWTARHLYGVRSYFSKL